MDSIQLKHLNFRIKHTYLLNILPLYRPPDEYPAALKLKLVASFIKRKDTSKSSILSPNSERDYTFCLAT